MKQNGRSAVYGMDKNRLALESDRSGFCIEPLFNMYKEISQVTSLLLVKYGQSEMYKQVFNDQSQQLQAHIPPQKYLKKKKKDNCWNRLCQNSEKIVKGF